MGRVSRAVLAAFVGAAFLAPGCATVKTTEWTGHTIDAVIAKLGPPDCTGPVPGSTSMTRYLWLRLHWVPVGTPDSAGGTLERSVDVEVWVFIVSPEGFILDWVHKY